MKFMLLTAFGLQVSLVAAFNLIEVENDFPMPAATKFECEKNAKLIKVDNFGLLSPSNPLILATPGPWGAPYAKGSNCDIKLKVPRNRDVFLFFEKIDLGNQTFGSDDDNLKITLGREKFKVAGPDLEKKILHFEATSKKEILFLDFSPNRNNEVGSGYRIWVFSQYAPASPPPPPPQGCPPKPQTVANFDASRYLGDWFQYSGTPSFFQPSGTSCVRATYGSAGPAGITVRNVAVTPNGTYDQICGFANTPNPAEPGSLNVFFPNSPPGDYWVIGTDYDSYASVYSCKELGPITFEYSWILLRDVANIDNNAVYAGLGAFVGNGLSTDFETIDHTGCDYEQVAACVATPPPSGPPPS